MRNWEDVLALLAMLPSLRLRPDEVFFGATLGRLGKDCAAAILRRGRVY